MGRRGDATAALKRAARPVSAGVLVYRRVRGDTEFLLAHPGGPFWRRRDAGAWSIPKGLVEPDEPPLTAALREFQEETGLALTVPLSPLAPIRQVAGKTVLAWAAEADLDLAAFTSNTFEMQWPPGSGRLARFPEIDRIAYFPAAEALDRILPAQAPFIRQILDASTR